MLTSSSTSLMDIVFKIITIVVLHFIGQINCQSTPLVLSIEEQNLADQCFTASSFTCTPTLKYRTIDGTCNNLAKPWWGSFNTPHVRLTRAAYKDDMSQLRVSVNGSDLPSARLLSTTFNPSSNTALDQQHTRMFEIFAQIIAHDVALNPQTGGSKCCSDSGDSIVNTSGTCRPISIPADDPFYSQFNRRCMEYHQSFLQSNCAITRAPALPTVLNTHFLDASFLYLSQPGVAQNLRSGTNGKLRIQNTTNGRQYLPLKTSCASKNCYDGDSRVNQNLDLAVIQTVFLRLHNFVCDKLVFVNPQWNDGTIFEEARRIVIAMYQHIIYNEWLPILIGTDFATKLNLLPLAPNAGYSGPYNPLDNPSTVAEFTGGAFRTLHTLIPSFISFSSDLSQTRQVRPYSTTVQKPGDFLQEGDTYDSILQGVMADPQEQTDRFFTSEITNNFQDGFVPTSSNGRFGDDIVARDIQRGRDYGLRPYNDFRQICGHTRATDFNGLSDSITDTQMIDLLSKIYSNVNDIDFYVGAVLEQLVPGTLSFPSLICIYGEQFRRYKFGDRYFYEFGDQPGSFTPSQLAFIKSITLSTLVCIGGDHILNVGTSTFFPIDATRNPQVSCRSVLDGLDFSSFKQS